MSYNRSKTAATRTAAAAASRARASAAAGAAGTRTPTFLPPRRGKPPPSRRRPPRTARRRRGTPATAARGVEPGRESWRSRSSWDEEREQQEAARRAGGEERNHREDRRQLQVSEAEDAMPGGAPARVRRAEADEEAAAHYHEHAAHAQQHVPRENLARHKAGEVMDPDRGKGGLRLGGDGDGVWAPEQHAAHEAADHDARKEDEVPQTRLPPVVLEVRHVARQARRAQVPQVARDAERLVAEQ